MNIINPATEEVIAKIKEEGLESATSAYHKLKVGQREWQKTSLEERIALIRIFYGLLKDNLQNLAEVLTHEMGKPLNQSVNEILGARKRIKFFIDNAEKWLADETVFKEQNLIEKIAYEPLGIIGNISAWNYPYLVGVNVFIPALIAGNGVLYKPSEYTTLTGIEIQKLLHRAGIPKNVFRTITGGKKTGEAMLKLPLDGYFFTGSYQTGKHIYKTVAHKMVPCQLELGGKDPLYVTDDNQNITAVAEAAAEGKFYNNGQSCCAVERIYVHQKVYQQFVDAFIQAVNQYKTGNPQRHDVFIGPLARKSQLEFLKTQVEDALQKGASLLMGGKIIKTNGYYFEPTVLVNVTHGMSVMKDETFGPVIGIQKVKNDDEAVLLMQDTPYGLTSAVYTGSRKRAEKIMKQMNTGTVYWNCCDRVSANLPWSGRKHSGIGSTLSHIGIRAFVRPKAYHLRNCR